ncbi:unnamed protein product [Prunus armeniaca]|uniref:Uncharacterized protein n=1 Tax=Prunus armeniaca TaxID=36596 RepID=A0A6J5V6Z9_PRUAR|nr:unnamed protein product [Prunus armeniaca]
MCPANNESIHYDDRRSGCLGSSSAPRGPPGPDSLPPRRGALLHRVLPVVSVVTALHRSRATSAREIPSPSHIPAAVMCRVPRGSTAFLAPTLTLGLDII